ncbi:MAG: MFS transporter, partial [Propionibacteriaceae bacterium]
MSRTVVSDSGLANPSVARIIWHSRFFRSAVISLFLAGIGVSAANPQLTLFFVNDLDASLAVAGLFYLTNLASPVVGFLIGRWSDRRPDRLFLFRVGGLVGTVGWLAMAFSTHIWMPFVISVVALSVAGAASAQIFAAARDELNRTPTGADNRVITTIRMAFTLGWIVGPVLGSWFGEVFGLRALLAGSAVLMFAQLLPFVGVTVRRYVPETEAVVDAAIPQTTQPAATPADPPVRQNRVRASGMVPLFVFTGLCIVAISGDTIKFAYLPIYMENELHLPASIRGAVIAIQPFFELLLIPLFGLLADRFGAMRLVLVGALLGMAGNACYALTSGVVGLFVAQTLMAGLWAAIAGLGINVAQHLYPQGVGVASSTFLGSIPVAASVGGVVGSIGVTWLGIPGVFYLPTILCGLSAVGLFVIRKSAQ